MESKEIASSLKPSPLSFMQPRKVFREGSGPCDTSGKNDRNSLQEWRYSKTLWTLGATVAGVASITAGTERIAFSKGVDDVGTDAGWGALVLSQAETNLFSDGSMNNAGKGMFVGRAMACMVDEAFAYNATVPTGGAKQYDQFMRVYSQQFQRLIAESVYMFIKDRDNALERYLGLPQMWPAHSSMTGDGLPTVGSPWGPATLVPLNEDFRFFDDNKGNATQIRLITPRNLQIVEDPANPIPAGFSVALNVMIYGGPVNGEKLCDEEEGDTKEGRLAMMKSLMKDGLSAIDAAKAVKELYS